MYCTFCSYTKKASNSVKLRQQNEEDAAGSIKSKRLR